ncbi:MAG: outer membrane beta-barrel protein [Bacteroidetes bacterium]|nr:outer membrane beta-barrel protein [Bacteroidota bacterium]MBS1929898.1 outer membrane beta-barrel protein [Bacteroidota bacterium]
MRNISILLFLLTGFSFTSFAQKNGTIKGIAFDTLAKQPLASATITVMQKKDSSLVTFTLTDNKGYFELKGIPNGEYRLLITHINYHNSNTYFTIDDNNKNIDLGTITMNDKNKVLDEVVIKNEAPPVTIINDTVQYNANSFKTPPNANVEQLLKKLPGVTVNKDGTIKAQGEKVQKVLVDGKEFFGNDPKIATKNLPADAVDKVQVYDKQSDQAQLTGFDDGNYEKTINLKLKADKKKGSFGKISAGGGTDGRYEGKFNVNSFKGARQMSVIGMGNNDNSEGFSFMDILNFTGALSQLKGGGGNININIGPDDPVASLLGNNNSAGIKTIWGGGVNYNNIIGKKIDLQSNYFYNHYDPNTKSNILRQYPDSSLYYQHSFSDNLNNNNRFNMNVLYQIDSSTSLRIIPSLTLQQTKNSSQNDYQTLSSANRLVNEGKAMNTSNTDGYNFQNTLLFRKKLNKKGRTFSLSLQTSLNNNNGDGSIESITGFYNQDGSLNRKDTLNQRFTTEGSLRGYNAKATYTEPLFKRSLLEFSVSRSDSKNTADKITKDYNGLNGKYDQLNPELSNNYSNSYSYNTGGLRMRTQRSRFNYMLGAYWQQADLQGTIISGTKDSMIKKTFYNILPNARVQYNFTKFKTLSINYATSTNQPAMSQLQPVPDVSDPLNIKMGNPELKQEFTHSIQGNLMLVSPYRNRNLFLFFTMNKTQNKIVNYDSLDQFGVRYSKPVNVNSVYNFNGDLNLGMPVRFLKGMLSLGTSAGYNKNKQFINSGRQGGGSAAPVLTGVNTFSLGPNLRLDINASDKLSIAMLGQWNYNHAKYSEFSSLNTAYLSQEYEADLDWQLPKNFFFSTDFTYSINNQLSSSFNTNIPIWNASISKMMLKYNRGELKFRVSDLLNRNTGISRTSNLGYIEDRQVTTLRRFFMISFIYSLSKTGLNNTGGGGMKVIMK